MVEGEEGKGREVRICFLERRRQKKKKTSRKTNAKRTIGQ
jgi:hypothetical protein